MRGFDDQVLSLALVKGGMSEGKYGYVKDKAKTLAAQASFYYLCHDKPSR